eukprot:CAMPEP_0204013914 /NCGR_PEP_ID=MMETSP0360-20130528/25032_1 /ASSEMBLY_ACC=CAM_ASM_000342 /TAXON_ID=268821 /ORGANISM="Scrippsiella Hangoei, Strain SHTV-5" /LENGTH=96 /DNA_ID=CAMNT_0050956719 /DNA_START=1 /DNA_END=287 /DNA_ORIENTATION=+
MPLRSSSLSARASPPEPSSKMSRALRILAVGLGAGVVDAAAVAESAAATGQCTPGSSDASCRARGGQATGVDLMQRKIMASAVVPDAGDVEVAASV